MSAIISDCGLYRYRLERDVWSGGAYGKTVVIMVNPSTADAEQDDPTIRKLLGFSGRWSHLIVGNLFAYRATDVKALAMAADPVGPENDEHLRAMIQESFRLIFAWGPLAKLPMGLRDRWKTVYAMARLAGKQPLSIGDPAKDGHPCHPLMLSYTLPLQEWSPPL